MPDATQRTQEALDRASSNANRLGGQIIPDAKIQIACMTLRALNDALRQPIQNLQPVVRGKTIANADRRLGDLVKDLSAVYKVGACGS